MTDHQFDHLLRYFKRNYHFKEETLLFLFSKRQVSAFNNNNYNIQNLYRALYNL